jgi:hypothetical protein
MMCVGIAVEHGGFELKKKLAEALASDYEVVDFGPPPFPGGNCARRGAQKEAGQRSCGNFTGATGIMKVNQPDGCGYQSSSGEGAYRRRMA